MNQNMPAYYTTLPTLHRHYREQDRKLGFHAKSVAEYMHWKKDLREKLMELTGLNRISRCDLKPRLIESIQLDGYRREKVVIQTEPDVWMPFYILIPDSSNRSTPVMLAPHGHQGAGKESVAGRKDLPYVQEAIEQFHYDYGLQLCHAGYVVFCPDARGFGERREYWMQGDSREQILNGSCNHLNHVACSMGLTLNGQMIWDLMRLIDYIQTSNRWNQSQIGCCGFSGGGLQTLWLAAQDDRITCAVISGYFYGCEDALLELTNCGCNYVPHFFEYADMGDLAALIAPRPLLIENGDQDHLNGPRGLENVLEQLAITQKAYALFGSTTQLTHHIYHGEHRWNGEQTAAFLHRYL